MPPYDFFQYLHSSGPNQLNDRCSLPSLLLFHRKNFRATGSMGYLALILLTDICSVLDDLLDTKRIAIVKVQPRFLPRTCKSMDGGGRGTGDHAS
jgi:hypothetical protein